MQDRPSTSAFAERWPDRRSVGNRARARQQTARHDPHDRPVGCSGVWPRRRDRCIYPPVSVDLRRRGDVATHGRAGERRLRPCNACGSAGRLLVDREEGRHHRFVAARVPGVLEKARAPSSPSELSDHDCVLFRGRNGKASWVLFSDDGEQIVDVRGSINSDEMEFVLRVAVAGAGIAAVPSLLARESLIRQELEVVLPRPSPARSDLHAASIEGVRARRVLLFRDHLVRELTRVTEAAATQCAGQRHPNRGQRLQRGRKRGDGSIVDPVPD